MLLDIINKILIVLFTLSCLTSLRHTYYFIQAWVKSTSDVPTKYKVGNSSLILLGVSLAYIITSIFTGITI